jgi:uncharacterized protein YjbI with pentapeptide repeats
MLSASGSAEDASEGLVADDRDLPSHARLIADCARSADRVQAQDRVHDLTEQMITETGRGLYLAQADLSDTNLSGFDLRYAILNRASLYGTRLAGADLTGASLVCAGMERTDFTDAILKGAYVHSMAAQASNFTRADLGGLVDATGALFHGCNLASARLAEAELAGTAFYQCDLAGTGGHGADLRGAVLNECRMDHADLTGARVDDVSILRSSIRGLILDHARGHGVVVQRPTSADGLSLAGAHLPGLRLSQVRSCGLAGAHLHAPGIDVQGCHLPGADLSHADLTRGRWDQSTLDDANVAGAVLADSSWFCVSARRSNATNATGESVTASDCTFAEALFAGFAGRYATFRNCDFRSADLTGAYLYRASFIGDPPASACLAGARLDGANLTQAYLAADFTAASIRQAWATYARVNQSVFADADLRGTSLFHASAVKTDFTGARLGGQRGAIFADRCRGLPEALGRGKDPDSKRIAELIEELTALLARDSRKST